MRFRTEIEPIRTRLRIDHDTRLLMLGSCFTDEIGSHLADDGFEVLHNPLGPLYNPHSLHTCIEHAASHRLYTSADLTEGFRGWHCLDYASRYSGNDADTILAEVNTQIEAIGSFLSHAPTVILTLGSAFVYRTAESGKVVGNCHKFPADRFNRSLLSVDEVADTLTGICDILKNAGATSIVFTVSPIRHLADGLHGNQISKATLLLGIDKCITRFDGDAIYFPSYEMLVDDLRDYRFYGADMKHPSPTAVEYIYEKFSDTFFSAETRAKALDMRHKALAARHRTIL